MAVGLHTVVKVGPWQTFSNSPRSLNFVTTLRIFRIGTAKDRPMSALPPKADIGTQSWDVCLVPKADIAAVAR